jgi:hypothetical protein
MKKKLPLSMAHGDDHEDSSTSKISKLVQFLTNFHKDFFSPLITLKTEKPSLFLSLQHATKSGTTGAITVAHHSSSFNWLNPT